MKSENPALGLKSLNGYKYTQVLTGGALYLSINFELDFQPTRWDFGLEKKISFWIVKILNNFCIFNNIPELLKKIWLVIVDNFCFFLPILPFGPFSVRDWLAVIATYFHILAHCALFFAEYTYHGNKSSPQRFLLISIKVNLSYHIKFQSSRSFPFINTL